MGKHNKISPEINLLDRRWKSVLLDDKDSGYYISDHGDLYSSKTNIIMKSSKNSDGYLSSILYVNKTKYSVSIHRLVAIAFIDNPDPANKIQVNHKDGNKENNCYWNLEWVTQQENIDHAVKTGLRDSFKGENSPKNKYSENTIKKICQMLEDGRSQKYISEYLGVNKGTVNSIKQNKVWKHVSCNYNIPKPISRISRPPGLRNKVVKLINDGYDNKSIIKLLKLPDNRLNRKYIAVIKFETKSKVNSSTTIDQL